MGRQSRDKGDRGELQVAKILDQYGINFTRPKDSGSGKYEDGDFVLDDGSVLEVKWRKVINKLFYEAIEDARKGLVEYGYPVGVVKANNRPWLAVMNFHNFCKIFKQLLSRKEGKLLIY